MRPSSRTFSGALWALSSIALVACGEPAAVPDDAPSRDVPARDAGAVTTRSAGIGPIRVAPGDEETVCMAVALDNDVAGSIVAIHSHLTEGSHHMIVSRADEVSPTTPTPCQPFALGISRTIFIAQQREAELVYPAGSGLRIDAHQPIRMELHYVNYVAESPIDIAGSVDFDIVTDDGELRQVQLLFTGELSFELPPREETIISSTHVLPEGASLFAITSHTHQLGIEATIDVVNGDGTTRIHTSDRWEDPPLDVFDPPMTVRFDDSLALRCVFQNTSDRTVRFGEEFDSEMCFLWAYYTLPEP